MAQKSGLSRIPMLLCIVQPRFLPAGAAPVLVGTGLGFAVSGHINWLMALLAASAMVALNIGANLLNDYFDHISGNDWINENPTPFSGGSRYIQRGLVQPRTVFVAGIICLAAGAAVGLIIIALTKSAFILILGITGTLAGLFWTAPPVRYCYRFAGEPCIFTVFGLLPVYGAYYLQTGTIDMIPLLPGCILGLLIAMVLLINAFPDAKADAAVNKRTFVVRYGVSAGIRLYRAGLAASYILAATAMLIYSWMFFAGLFYFFTLPLAAAAVKYANKTELTTPGQYRANKVTIILHSAAAAALAAGFVVYRFAKAGV